MKRTRIFVSITAIILSVVSLAISQSSTTRKIISVSFDRYGSYTWPSIGGLPGTLSIDMTMLNPVSNTFTLSYVRSNVTHVLLQQSANPMQTVVWYTPSPYLFQTGDRIVWTNAVSGSSVLTINTESK